MLINRFHVSILSDLIRRKIREFRRLEATGKMALRGFCNSKRFIGDISTSLRSN